MTILLAYIDPGLGALIWQSAIATIVGFVFYLNKTRRWIVKTIRKMSGFGPKTTAISPKISISPERLATKVETKTEVR